MISIICSILLLIAGLIIPFFIKDALNSKGEVKYSYKVPRIAIRSICIIVAIMIIIFSCFTTVQTGYSGIPVRFGQVQSYVYDAGLHFKSPFVNVVEMDNREQRFKFDLAAFSSDIQEVAVKGSINYSINKDTAMNLYKTVGTDYANILITPRAQEAIKATFAKYTAEGLISNRQQLSTEIFSYLSEDLADAGINIISVSIEDIDFTDAFTNAVEAKQVATQEKQKAQTEQERMTMEQKAAAERAVISAKADADMAKIAAEAELEVVKIQAEAALYAGEKEAEMNKRISESLSNELLYYYWIKQWNGKLPAVATDTMMPILNIDEVIKDE